MKQSCLLKVERNMEYNLLVQTLKMNLNFRNLRLRYNIFQKIKHFTTYAKVTGRIMDYKEKGYAHPVLHQIREYMICLHIILSLNFA